MRLGERGEWETGVPLPVTENNQSRIEELSPVVGDIPLANRIPTHWLPANLQDNPHWEEQSTVVYPWRTAYQHTDCQQIRKKIRIERSRALWWVIYPWPTAYQHTDCQQICKKIRIERSLGLWWGIYPWPNAYQHNNSHPISKKIRIERSLALWWGLYPWPNAYQHKACHPISKKYA
jgi:hypothetical protein